MTEAAELNYESLFNRCVAALIDNVLWLVAVGWVLGSFPESTYEDHPEVIGIVLLVIASAWFNYFAICEWRWGRTVGKNAMGSRVLLVDGGKPGFGPISIRNVLRLVDFFFIGPIMIASSARRQRLGDRLAHTVVVRDRGPTSTGGSSPSSTAASSSSTPGAAGEGPGGVDRKDRAPRQGAAAGITWSAGQTWRGLLAGLGLSLFVAPLLVVPFDPDFSSLGAVLVGQLLLAAALIGVALHMARGPGEFDLRASLRRLGWRRFGISALGTALLMLFVYYIAVAIFASIVVQPKQEDIGGDLGCGVGVAGTLAAYFLIGVVGPAAEETFFRGFFFAGLRSRFSLWPAALISGVVFGGIHAPTGVTTVVPLAILGVGLAWLYERTGSLWPCVAAHVANNLLALLISGC